MESEENNLKALNKAVGILNALDEKYGNRTIFGNDAKTDESKKSLTLEEIRSIYEEKIQFNEQDEQLAFEQSLQAGGDLEIFYITKKDFKNIERSYHTKLSEYLFDSLELDYLTYSSFSPKINRILKNNDKINYTKPLNSLLEVSGIVDKILSIEFVSNHNRIKFEQYRDSLMIYILTISDLDLRVKVLKGLIKFYKEETVKGKNHLRIKLLDFERLLPELMPKKNIIIPNPHKRIFANDFAYNCFEQLRKIVKNDLADYSFIYRKMIKDKLIFESVGESEFRYFLDKNCEVSIGKMKQLYLCSTEIKEQLYTTIKDSIS